MADSTSQISKAKVIGGTYWRSDVDERFFSRCATRNRMDELIVVHDSFSPSAPRMITMEPWHEVVFMAADGRRTVAEFTKNMAAQYENGEPPGLRKQIHDIVSTLVAEGILRLHDQPEGLRPYFGEDFFQQDPEIRKQQMKADGLVD